MPTSPDLLKDVYAVDPKDKDYTLVTITDLNPGETYGVQFAWVYPDKRPITEDNWSITKEITASTEAQPNPPQFLETDLTAENGRLYVRWNGVDSSGNPYKGIDRVEVFISDSADTFGDGTTPSMSFKVRGTQSIAAKAGTYYVVLKAVTLLGTYSEPSTERNATVTEAGATIELPTLPIGLTAESIAFGLKVTWGGAYAGDNSFDGFKSINVYAVNSNLGSTTTTGISSSNQVATLSVNDVHNSSNIPLGTYVGYSQDTYLYYVAVNENNIAYSVGGATVYTRINSSALRPDKANYIDLENGVISIENLVAGNGQFQSWLRAGAYNGARVEISGLTTDIIDPNHSDKTIFRGLSIYDSGGEDKSFYADLSGNLTITGTINATSGYIGGANGWSIQDDMILAIGSSSMISMVSGGTILFSDVAILSTGGSFSIIDFISGENLMTTDSTNGGRIYLGDENGNRQVELGRSAQVAGSPNVNSGGLRNMYTVTQANFSSTIYLSDNLNNGDVLLVYDPTS